MKLWPPSLIKFTYCYFNVRPVEKRAYCAPCSHFYLCYSSDDRGYVLRFMLCMCTMEQRQHCVTGKGLIAFLCVLLRYAARVGHVPSLICVLHPLLLGKFLIHLPNRWQEIQGHICSFRHPVVLYYLHRKGTAWRAFSLAVLPFSGKNRLWLNPTDEVEINTLHLFITEQRLPLSFSLPPPLILNGF